MNILLVNSTKNWSGVRTRTLTFFKEIHKEHRVFALVRSGLFAEKLSKYCIKTRTWNTWIHFNPFTFFYLTYLIYKFKIDVIITNIDKDISNSGLASKITGIPLITLVGSENDFKASVKNIFIRRFLVSHFICSSTHILKTLLSTYPWLMGRISYIRNPVQIPEELAVHSYDKVRIATVSRLSKEKNIPLLLNAISKLSLQAKAKIEKVIVAGKGAEKEELIALTKNLGIDNIVNFVGHLENTDDLFKEINLLVLPSLREGQGMVLLEAMAFGVGVIASNVGGIPETVADSDASLLFESDNLEQLTDALSALILNTDRLKTLGVNGYEYVKHKYNIKEIAVKLLDLFQQECNRP